MLFEVAYQLKVPIQIVYDMPHEDLLKWLAYFERRPVDWRDDDRTYKLLQAQGVKARPTEIFASLAMMQKIKDATPSNPLDTLKGSYLFSKILEAKGGERLNVD